MWDEYANLSLNPLVQGVSRRTYSARSHMVTSLGLNPLVQGVSRRTYHGIKSDPFQQVLIP